MQRTVRSTALNPLLRHDSHDAADGFGKALRAGGRPCHSVD